MTESGGTALGFAKGFGLIEEVIPYEALVATEFSPLWTQ